MIRGCFLTGEFAAGTRRLPRYSLLGVSGWWSLRVEYQRTKVRCGVSVESTNDSVAMETDEHVVNLVKTLRKYTSKHSS